MQLSLNKIEIEVVPLLAVYDLIDSIVNRAILDIGDGPKTEVRFHDNVHARYFNLALVDLLSLTDRDAPLPQRTYLQALYEICEQPSFDDANAVDSLRKAVDEFRTWLTAVITVGGMWLPSIPLEIDLKIKRIDLLKIAGNICKHNVLRSVRTMREFQKVLAQNNAAVELNQTLLAMDDVYEWFHTHKFIAQSNAIAEFLNNLRWGIRDYLSPEYRRSKVSDVDGIGYRYTYPEDVKDDLARASYWELMNRVRASPYLQRFEVAEFWKGEVDKY